MKNRSCIRLAMIWLITLVWLSGCKKDPNDGSDQPGAFRNFSIGSIFFEIEGNNITGHTSAYTDRKGMIPVFSANGKVFIDNVEQISGTTVVDLDLPKKYKVVATDGTTKEYTIKMTSFTDLPVLFVTTEGNKEIVSEDDYLKATFVLDPNGNALAQPFKLTGNIKGRGNSTWSFVKKPYKIKFDSKTALFGASPVKEWVLLANYADKTLIRNFLANKLSSRLGMAFTPMSQFIELFVNGQHRGSYMISDQVEVGPSRVNINELGPADNGSALISGGYLLEIDQRILDTKDEPYFESYFFPIVVKSPKAPSADQMNYIKSYLQEAENVLIGSQANDPVNGFRKYFDEDSFIKWYLVNEIFKNVDSRSFSSIYFYKPRNGKIFFGPVWDFDLGAGNANHNAACQIYQGFYTQYNKWFTTMYQDPAFQARVTAIWKQYRKDILEMTSWIDEEGKVLALSEVENFKLWPLFSDPSWCVVPGKANYEQHVAWLKQFLSQRIDWLDQQFK
ncbi:MAG: CotH kinase family protein [Marinilabiliales bacterium]|nr:CotH kinase family protein [Marinilabiliales bacterium]